MQIPTLQSRIGPATDSCHASDQGVDGVGSPGQKHSVDGVDHVYKYQNN